MLSENVGNKINVLINFEGRGTISQVNDNLFSWNDTGLFIIGHVLMYIKKSHAW